MAERLDSEGHPDPCGACMSTEAAMIYRGTPWCSDTCRKDMLATLETMRAATPELRALALQRMAAEERRGASEIPVVDLRFDAPRLPPAFPPGYLDALAKQPRGFA